MLKLRPRSKKIESVLIEMSKHKNADALQKLINVFDCEAENLRTWEYYSSSEMEKIIENNKPIKKIIMSERRKRTETKNENNDNFVKGIMVFEPNDRAPNFCVATVVINRDDLIDWLDNEDNSKFFKNDEKYGDTLTLNLNESKGGKLYLGINTYGTDAQEDKSASESKANRRNRKK